MRTVPRHFDSDLHALVTGLVMGSLQRLKDPDEYFVCDVGPVLDPESNYTNQMKIVTNSGKTFTLTLTEDT